MWSSIERVNLAPAVEEKTPATLLRDGPTATLRFRAATLTKR